MFGNSKLRVSKEAKRVRSQIRRRFKSSIRTISGSDWKRWQPLVVVEPQSQEELVDLVKLCDHGGVRILPTGYPYLSPVSPDSDVSNVVIISTRNLNQPLEFDEKNRLLTVQSGMTLKELQILANTLDMHLPIDAPHKSVFTIGCAVADNAHGLRSMRYGPIARYVEDCSAVFAGGQYVESCSTTALGRVRELDQMLIGSHGSLGVISSVTLRLVAPPEDFRMAMIFVDSCFESQFVIDHVHGLEPLPSMIEVINAQAAREFGYELEAEQMIVCVAYEEPLVTNDEMMARLRTAFGTKLIGLEQEEAVEEYRELESWSSQDCALEFEVCVPKRCSGEFLDLCAQFGIAAIGHVGTQSAVGICDEQLPDEFMNAAQRLCNSKLKIRRAHQPPQLVEQHQQDLTRAHHQSAKKQLDPRGLFAEPRDWMIRPEVADR